MIEARPNSFACYDFVNEQGVKEKKTAVVAPIKTECQGSVVRISWACSRGPYCHDSTCRYSETGRRR